MKRESFESGPSGSGRRIAVVGGGVAGLTCAWLLGRRDRVTLFEEAPRLGGHTNTVTVELEGCSHPVDTGFLVFNRHTYPNLCALFALLGVEAVESDMSFSVSLGAPDLEWSGTSLGTVFAQRSNLLRPAFWSMMRDLMRFNRDATRLATGAFIPQIPLGEYLARARYGQPFRDWYLLPMAAAIWSCPPRRMLDYPLETFVRFCHNHGLLRVLDRPKWMTVKGGGRSYVRKLSQALEDVRTGVRVGGLMRDADGVWLFSTDGAERFDEVVLACHSDQSARILGSAAFADERRVLSAVPYQPNVAWLHTDPALLPRRPSVWSAWNYLAHGQDPEAPVSVSYLINRLQPLPFQRPVVVSLNPAKPPRDEHVLARFEYAHPVFDQGAIDAQRALADLQGRAHVWFAGAWTGHGFHEDGVRSALAVASALGAPAPWQGGLRPLEIAG
ncbi:MAG: FAD-dependent oxidoreductase [Rhodocyclaceae bacterium]|nr:FAD-dependent oxidoreductase [Rhodocyclaceae bacterium]